jgi:hypothetical protein
MQRKKNRDNGSSEEKSAEVYAECKSVLIHLKANKKERKISSDDRMASSKR